MAKASATGHLLFRKEQRRIRVRHREETRKIRVRHRGQETREIPVRNHSREPERQILSAMQETMALRIYRILCRELQT